MSKVKYATLLIAILYSCHSSKKLITVDNPLYQHTPKALKYDTLSGTFFYENYVLSYLESDVVLKSGGFIKAEMVSERSYKGGYYVGESSTYVQYLKQRGISVRYDAASIANFYDSLFKKGINTGTYRDITDINPFCGAYYKKYDLNIEVLFIDTVKQRVPLFMNCKGIEEFVQHNGGKNYKIDSLPTYIITKVLSWREL